MALSTVVNNLQVRDNATFAMTPATSINNYVLTANTPVNITVSDLVDANGIQPNTITFGFTADIYVKWNGTGAAVPSGLGTTNGTGVEFNPVIRKISGSITQFSIVSASNCIVTLSLFQLSN